MSAVDNIMGLSKYIVVLPETPISVSIMVFLSFLTGIIAFLIEPDTPSSILASLVYGGSAGFLIFGLTSIMAGGITQPLANAIKGSRHMKMKQSMFLSLSSMFMVAVIYIIGSLVSSFTIYNYTIDALIYGCALIFAFRTIVIWGTSNIGVLKSILISTTQPLLILSMVMVIVFLTGLFTNIGYFSIIGVLLKIIIASLILMFAIYSFVAVIESPMRKNLGVGGLELLSLFIAHITEGSHALEGLFEDMGEPIDTLVGILGFKSEKGLKAIFLSPCVHPGPIGNIGGGNMPTILANRFECFTMVSHGPSTHDFNPVACREIYKIETVVKKSLENMEYSEDASKFVRVNSKGAKIGAQYFGNNLILLATFSPKGFDDIDFGVGLAIMNYAQSFCDVENVLLVDCHNCFKGEGGRVLPGNKEVFQLIDAIKKLKKPGTGSIKVGCAFDPLQNLSKEHGIGQSGIKVMVVELELKDAAINKENPPKRQSTAYILLDANNMVEGFREQIIQKVKELGVDCAEVMTSDTHFVNTLSGGHNPVGKKKKDEIIAAAVQCTAKALDDLEPVEAGCKVARIEDIKTLGPTHATELVTTISSIIAVSRIFAPLVCILALLFAFIWVFYGAF